MRKPLQHFLAICCSLVMLLIVSGCTSLYFRPAEQQPSTIQFQPLELPYSEYWAGIVFNGNKIGFSHMKIAEAEHGMLLHSTANLRFRFLTIDKAITINATAHVDTQLQLQSVQSTQLLDGNRIDVTAIVADKQLTVTTSNRGEQTVTRYPLQQPLYPSSAIMLVPLYQGITVGSSYHYNVFDSETRTITNVSQKVTAYEKSDLFSGNAYRIETEMLGQKVTTWLDNQGLPQLEIASNGVLIAGLETQQRAERYLAEAALNKSDVILQYSLIPATVPQGRNPLSLQLHHQSDTPAIPSSDWQQCQRVSPNQTNCMLSNIDLNAEPTHDAPVPTTVGMQSSLAVPYKHPQIATLASSIIGKDSNMEDNTAFVQASIAWMSDNIEQQAVDGFSAIDVLQQQKAECQGHAYLLAALARNRNIATKVVNGVVYAPKYGGFLYHSWNEVWLYNRWIPVDPTLRQFPADNTHIKLIEGEEISDLLPLSKWVGTLTIAVQ